VCCATSGDKLIIKKIEMVLTGWIRALTWRAAGADREAGLWSTVGIQLGLWVFSRGSIWLGKLLLNLLSKKNSY
jgi:hypothetical protein